MRARQHKTQSHTSIKARTALVKLRIEKIKLGAFASNLKAKAQKLKREEEYRLDKVRNSIEDLKDECFLQEIKHLQDQLSFAQSELKKAKHGKG